MQRGRKLIALREVLGPENRIKGEEAIFFCPKHGHKVGRREGQLSINLVTDKFHCWSCGWGSKSSIEPILRIKKSELYHEYVNERKPKEEALPERKYDKVLFPKEFRSLSVTCRSPYYRQAITYLESRGITSDDILTYKLGYCEDGEYKNRIIIPSFDEYGELNFYTGRHLFENNAMKYKHGEFCKDIIFNDYLIDWDKPVTLVEGPFDAIKTGTNAIPLQGTQLRSDSKLFHRIIERQSEVYLALDKDAWNQQMKIVELLSLFGVTVHMIMWGDEYKDPGDMPKGHLDRLRSKAIAIGDSLSMLRLRVENSSSFRNI